MKKGSDSKNDRGDYLLDNYELSGEYTGETVESISSDDSSQQALDKVKSILKPVNIFLIIIGWSPIVVPPYKKKLYFATKVWNRVWPVIVFSLLASTLVIQVLSCDKRSEFYSPKKENISYHQLLTDCLRNLISYYIFPTVLTLIGYAYMLFLIRRQYAEHFENMMGRVFLLYTQKRGRLSQTTLRRTVWLIFVLAVTWLVYAISLLVFRSIVHVILHQPGLIELLAENEFQSKEHPLTDKIILIIEPIPIVLHDLFYVAQLLSYSIQAQLLIYFFNGINDRIKLNEIKLQDAIKEIEHGAEILSTINGKVAISVSLVIMNISLGLINAFHQLWSTIYDDLNGWAFAYEIMNIIRWVVILYVPIIQAMLITISGKRIVKVGLFLKTRPFGYAETSQEDLNYFQLYTSNLGLRGKLFGIPVRPQGVAFFVLFLLLAAFLWFSFDPNLGKVYWV